MIEIPQAEWLRAWQHADEATSDRLSYEKHLANLVVWVLAGWERERFEREHTFMIKKTWPFRKCRRCGYETNSPNWDQRHTWTLEQWAQSVRERLEGRK